MVGSYFCYDNPGVIEPEIEEIFDIGPEKESLLYAVYSYPNCFLPIFGGVFLDKVGIRVGLMLFITSLTLGQVVFCFGGFVTNFNIMLAGRFIFGLGGESLSVT
jgi:MFS family permease